MTFSLGYVFFFMLATAREHFVEAVRIYPESRWARRGLALSKWPATSNQTTIRATQVAMLCVAFPLATYSPERSTLLVIVVIDLLGFAVVGAFLWVRKEAARRA